MLINIGDVDLKITFGVAEIPNALLPRFIQSSNTIMSFHALRYQSTVQCPPSECNANFNLIQEAVTNRLKKKGGENRTKQAPAPVYKPHFKNPNGG